MNQDALRRAVAEFVGTFALIFIGVGAIVVGGDTLGVAFAHGLVIAVMASAVGHISGGHFNPAVTLAFVVTRRMELGLAGVYWATQFLAATAGALAVKLLLPEVPVDLAGTGAPALGEGIGAGSGLVIELILTFFLVWVIFASAADTRGTFKSVAGLAIGLTLTAAILIGGPLTGAALNPARAFGPELVGGEWGDFWVWYLGPLAGGALAGLAYEFLYLRPLAPVPVGPPETGLEEPRPGETAAS